MFCSIANRLQKSIPARSVTRVFSKRGYGFVDKPAPGKVVMIGAALADGQPIKGVEKAPAVFRENGIEKVVRGQGWDFEDRGDVKPVVKIDESIDYTSDAYYPPGKVKNTEIVGAGCGAVAEAVRQAASGDDFVLIVGGDHSIAAGSLTGIAMARPDTAYLWIDAHADCNTPDTSPSGNYHGMPLGHVMGWFGKRCKGFEWCDDHIAKHGPIKEERVAIIALRDVDESEKELLRKSDVHVFTMSDVDHLGIGTVMDLALKKIDPKGRRNLHVSCDIDSADPGVAPGTGTLCRGGLSYREAHYIMEVLSATGRLGSIDFVEINPGLDVEDKSMFHGDDPNITGTSTVRFALGLMQSVLGKTIV